MGKAKRKKLSQEEKQKILSEIEAYAKENNCSIRAAERALNIKPNSYYSYKRNRAPEVVIYKNKDKKEGLKKPARNSRPESKMTLVMGTPDQIRELLRGQ